MLDFLVALEEQEREEGKIEAFKATILTAFPSRDMYKKLYLDEESEDLPEGIVEAAPDEYQDIRSIIDLIHDNESFIADDADITTNG
jgi:hypothetical protein